MLETLIIFVILVTVLVYVVFFVMIGMEKLDSTLGPAYRIVCMASMGNGYYLAIKAKSDNQYPYLVVLDKKMHEIKQLNDFNVERYTYNQSGKTKYEIFWNGYVIVRKDYQNYYLLDENLEKIEIPYKCAEIQFLTKTSRFIKVTREGDEPWQKYEGIIDIDLNTCIKPIYTSIRVFAGKYFAAYILDKGKTDIYLAKKDNTVKYIGSIDEEVVDYDVYNYYIYFKTRKEVEVSYIKKRYYGLYDRNLNAVIPSVCDSITDINQNGGVLYIINGKSDTLNVEKQRYVSKRQQEKERNTKSFSIEDVLTF